MHVRPDELFGGIGQGMAALRKTSDARPANNASNVRGHALPRSRRGPAKPASVLDALNALAGNSPKARARFSRGRCVRGTYVPSDRAKELTHSRSFTRPSRVLARFSVGSNLGIPDTSHIALHGFSFRLGDDQHRSDILTQDAPVHFAKTADQMLAFLRARIPGADGKPDAEKIRAFSAANPETLHQAKYLAAHPWQGFADTTYWGVHCFPAMNAQSETRFFKFKVEPVGGDAVPPEKQTRAGPVDVPKRAFEQRIAAGDVRFSVMALLDRPGDPTLDVTTRWPDEDRRESLRLGTIVITGIEAEHACEACAFNPANLAEGIGFPPDEIFAARRAAYAFSQTRRR
jgi:catalase